MPVIPWHILVWAALCSTQRPADQKQGDQVVESTYSQLLDFSFYHYPIDIQASACAGVCRSERECVEFSRSVWEWARSV